jgi:hypothetical protein
MSVQMSGLTLELGSVTEWEMEMEQVSKLSSAEVMVQDLTLVSAELSALLWGGHSVASLVQMMVAQSVEYLAQEMGLQLGQARVRK